jgi:hypothetical protein
MLLVLTCPGCQANVSAPEEAAGKPMRCPTCKTVVVVPAPRNPLVSAPWSESVPQVSRPVPEAPDPWPGSEEAPRRRRGRRRVSGLALLPLALLPLGLPLVGLAFQSGWFPMLLLGFVGLLLTGASVGIVVVRSLPTVGRVLGALGVAGAGYLATALLFWVIHVAMNTPTLPGAAWQEFKSPDGSCRMQMPGPPQRKPQFVAEFNQTVDLHAVGFDTGSGKISFGYTGTDIPPQFQHVSLDDRFRGAKEKMIQALPGATLVSERRLLLANQHPGYEFVLDGGHNGRAYTRLYVVEGRRLYMIAALGPVAEVDAYRFLDSFQLLQNPPQVAQGDPKGKPADQPKEKGKAKEEVRWQEFRGPDGCCRMQMPGPPAAKPQFLPETNQNVDLYTAWVDANRAGFTFSGYDIPEKTRHVGLEDRFRAAREDMLRVAAGAVVVSERRLQLANRHPGYELVLKHEARGKAHARMFVVGGRRVYALAVIGSPTQEEVTRFLDSFEVLKDPPPDKVPTKKQDPLLAKLLEPAPPLPGPFPRSPDQRTPIPLEDQPWPPDVAAQLPDATRFAGLIGYWKFDEGRGVRVDDASGQGNHGTVRGGWWVNGVKGKGLLLDGHADHFDFGDSPRYNYAAGSGFTVAGWFLTKRNQGSVLSQRNYHSDLPAVDVSVESGKLWGTVRCDNAPGSLVRLKGQDVALDKWQHFALVREPDGTVELFLNGVSQGRLQKPGSDGAITTNLRAVGYERYLAKKKETGPRYHLHGSVDEFCIFSRALSAAEVERLAGLKR